LYFIDGCWNDILAEIGEVIVEAFLENAAIEHIDTHRGLVEVGIGRLADGLPEIGGNAQTVEDLRVFWLFNKLNDPALLISMHDPETRRRLPIHRNGAHCQVRICFNVLAQNLAVVHSVELIAAQNDIVIEWTFEEVAEVLPNGVRGSLVPMRSRGRLLRGQNLHETWREIVEFEGGANMLVQRHAIKLGKHVDAANAGIQTVADGDINQPIFATKRYGGLGPFFCQREESGAGSAAHNNGKGAVDWKNQGWGAHKVLHLAPGCLNCHAFREY
jgi:hypothetical protein